MDGSSPTALDAERRRVAAHIAHGERSARARDVSFMPTLKRFVRALLLDELERYHARGTFPKNRDFPGALTPYFVDVEGTRCAVAHMLEVSGEDELMARIARERNNALVPEFGVYDRLSVWLDAVGLTLEEAARIQPSYGCSEASMCLCGGYPGPGGHFRVPVDGIAEASRVRFVDADGGQVRAVFRVDAVHGRSSYAVGREIESSNIESQSALYVTAQSTLRPGATADAVYFLSAEGTVDCRVTRTETLSVPKSDAIRALQSADCRAQLIARDRRFQVGDCPDSTPRTGPGSLGAPASAGCECNLPGAAAGGGDPTTLGVLTALLGVLLARRARG